MMKRKPLTQKELAYYAGLAQHISDNLLYHLDGRMGDDQKLILPSANELENGNRNGKSSEKTPTKVQAKERNGRSSCIVGVNGKSANLSAACSIPNDAETFKSDTRASRSKKSQNRKPKQVAPPICRSYNTRSSGRRKAPDGIPKRQ